MKIAIAGYARHRQAGDVAFEGVRQVRAAGTEPGSTVEMRFAAATVACQAGGARRSGTSCMRCKRFQRLVENDSAIAVQCRWSHADPVSAIMKLTTALVTVPSTTRVRLAKGLLREGSHRHLLVVDHYRLSGILARRDVAARATRGETIAHRFTPSPWVIDADATLGQAAALMKQREVGCLPVVRGGYLQGLLTDDILVELGVLPTRP